MVPVADPSVLNTCTVISVDDGLLRISTGSTDSSLSPTAYDACPKLTVGATELVYNYS